MASVIPHLVIVRVIENDAFTFLPRPRLVAYTTSRKDTRGMHEIILL